MSQESKYDPHFYGLVMSLQGAVYMHLGKQVSPVSGKVERNLEAAKQSIELLEMLANKTVGNLTAAEKKFLEHALFESRMNFVDEAKKAGEGRIEKNAD